MERRFQQLANNNADLAPFVWPLLYAYFGFVLLTWLAPSFFNLLLRLDRYGRYALSRDQVLGANLLAACLVVVLGCLILLLTTGNELFFYATLTFAVLSLPASAIYVCDAGWPRQTMAAITLVLLTALLFVLTVGFFETSLPPPVVKWTVGLMSLLP